MSTNPNTVKSQHELTNEGGRKSDVLVEAISKLETTTKQLEKTKKQLDIAVKALKGVRVWANTGNGGEQAVKNLCDKTLRQIEDLNK